jgi:hypothetical protein
MTDRTLHAGALALIVCLSSSLPCLGQARPDWAFPGTTWATKTPAELGLDAAKLDALKTSLIKNSTGSSKRGGVIIKDGYLVYSWDSSSTNHNWASASKPVVSTMLFSAINEGRVGSVDSLIYDWGWALRTADQTMAFRHLADMTSGYAVAENPGERWAYNDYAIQLYINTLDKVFGTTDHLVTAGNSRFRDPMQFQDGTLFESSKGRVRSSARDFARMGWLWTSKGYWGGSQMLPKSFFDNYSKADAPSTLLRTVTPDANADDYLGVGTYGGGVNQTSRGPGYYGFNWWFNKNRDNSNLAWPAAPADTYQANGRWGKDVMTMMPSMGLVVAAWNDDYVAWGDERSLSAGDPNSPMNLNLKLMVEACANVTDRSWNVSSGDWSTVGNWNANGGSVGLPGSLRRGVVDNGGTVNITSGTATAKVLYVGDKGSGTAALSGGTLTGEYVVVGYEGKGVFNHSGGTTSPSSALHVGYLSGSTGIYQLSGGGVISVAAEHISGLGRFTQTGGLNSVGGTLTIGSFAGSSATYQLQGGTLKAPMIRRGVGVGDFQFTGGTLMANRVEMDLANGGGVLCPGQSIGATTIAGNYQQTSGKLEMEVASAASFDTFTVTGQASLGGTLKVLLAGWRPKEGDVFSLLDANSFAGAFVAVSSDANDGIPVGMDPFSGRVVVEPSANDRYEVSFNGFTAGDAQGDHAVSLLDLGVLGANWGQADRTWSTGDWNHDGECSLIDLGTLAANWSWTKPAGAPVPEPTALAVLGAGALALLRRRRG